MPAAPAARLSSFASARRLVALYLGGALALWALHHAVLFLDRFADFDCPPNWPFSIFNPRGPRSAAEIGALLATIAAGAAALRRLPRRGWPVAECAAWGLLLLFLTTAAQGVPKGFFNPVAGGKMGQQYYHDSLTVAEPAAFLRDFNRIQPALQTHARTHPPGAVLLFWALRAPLGLSPAVIGTVIAVFATLLTAAAFPFFVRALLGPDRAPPNGFSTLLLLVLPATQIYYAATLDAVIAALLLAAAALWLRPPTVASTLGASLLIAAASFLTFGFAWAAPTLFFLDLSRRVRPWWRIAVVPLVLGVLYVGLYRTTGFHFVEALRTASRLENPEGFRLLAEPLSYAITRLENVAEMAAFFGPLLLVLAGRGLPLLRRGRLPAGGALLGAVATLAGLFLTGAYHTGETARACLFLYPYLLLPVLAALRDAPDRDRALVVGVVLAQTAVMQGWGNWFW